MVRKKPIIARSIHSLQYAKHFWIAAVPHLLNMPMVWNNGFSKGSIFPVMPTACSSIIVLLQMEQAVPVTTAIKKRMSSVRPHFLWAVESLPPDILD